jgi:hypothetical protein
MVEEKKEIVRKTVAIPNIVSLRLLIKASIEYKPRWPGKSFSLHRTGLYTFSRLFIQDVFRVGHPNEA